MQKNNLDCVELLKELISFKTITPDECGIYEYIHKILSPLDLLHIEQELNEVKNILFYTKNLKNKKKNLKHICFAGHIDVVPPGSNWESDPFCANIVDDTIIGRGAQDMKGGISAFLSAIYEFLLNIDSKIRADSNLGISILLTSDEEGPGIYGTKAMLELMSDKNLLPDMAIVAEPTSNKVSADVMKIGRRGSINGKILIHGKQGHVAYPQLCINPIELLGDRLKYLAGVNLDEGDEQFDASKLVITDIRAGMQLVNVTPSELSIMFNVRNGMQTSPSDIKHYIEKTLSGLDFSLEIHRSAEPFITDSNNELVDKLSSVIKEICGFSPTLSTSGGTSDARFFGARKIPVIELGVVNDKIHTANESVKISDLQTLQKIFLAFLRSMTSK